MVAPDDDRRLELPARHHLVEGEAETVPVAEAHPADARRQTLKLDALAGHIQPVMQMAVLGQELAHPGIRPEDVLRIARECYPAERAHPAAEEWPDISRHEPGKSKGLLQALVKGHLADVVAVVEDRNAELLELEHRLDMAAHGGA